MTTLTDVNIITKMNWGAFLQACMIAAVGQLIPIGLSLSYPSLVVYGQVLGVVFTIGGIFQGLRIQTINLAKAITITGPGSRTDVKAVPHKPECAAYEKKCQALGKTHYEVPMSMAEQCTCSCHKG